MIPVIGWGATGGKLINKGAKYYKSLKLTKVAKKGNELLKLAKKYGINANSLTSKQLLENFDMRAAAKFRKGTINRELGDMVSGVPNQAGNGIYGLPATWFK